MLVPRLLYKYISVTVLMLALPGLLAATSISPACQAGPPTPESYKWNFPKEADSLLQEIQQHAMRARSLAAKLQSFDFDNGENHWQMDAGVLQQIKAQVNPMDHMLCRLRTIKRVALPWQQKEINRIAPAVVELTDTTQFEVSYLNKYHGHLWNPTYTSDATDMYNEANRIVGTVRTFEEYAQASREIRQLRPELGLGAKATA
jgi:hypothetical protein